MFARRRALAAAIGVTTLGVASLVTAQTPRDGQRPPATGTSTVAGVVMLDDPQSKPLRRARVMVNGPQLTVGRTVITNDDGTFSIEGLPAGRYTVGVAKDGYLPMNFGAKRPGRAGIPVVVRDGETRTVTLRLPRGGVITGTLVDASGEPVSGVTVTTLRYRFVPAAGERLPAAEGLSVSTTDDRGSYRIFGLSAGQYVVAALFRPMPRNTGEIQTLSEADIRRALAEVGQTTARTQPGPSLPAPTPRFEAVEPPRPVSLAPVFYPGTTDMANAVAVNVGRGEERRGVDFQIHHVRTATLSGFVSGTAGAAPASVILSRSDATVPFDLKSARTTPDGQFTISGILPGRYVLLARTTSPAGLWAMTDVVVDGEDEAGIGLTMQPGLTVSGKIVFEGTRPPPPDLSKLQVRIPLVLRAGTSAAPLPALQLQPNARFTIAGIVPGLYRSFSALQGLRASVGGWWLKSIIVSGREMLDGPIELRQSASDAVVTFSDRASELTGRVTDGRGNTTSEYTVVVFPPERRSWFTNSRRVAGQRPGADGKYSIRNLPPGEYLLAVSDDLEPNEWFDPEVLQELAAGAMRLTIAEDEKKTQDVVK